MVQTAVAVPNAVLEVMQVLEQAGFQAYLVGGSVRDILLGRCPKDYDIATDAVPAEVKSLFERAVPTGERFGTVTVLGEVDVEVTTFRKDGRYVDGRRPETVEFSQSLREDVARRDFTLNALARTRAGEVIDYVGGLQDLSRRVVRCVGDPDTRFKEDALRMMRAFRLLAQLGEGFSIEPDTFDAISRNAHFIVNVSWERIRDELVGILTSDRPGVLRDIRRAGLLRHVLPELGTCLGLESSRDGDGDLFEHTVAVVENSPNRLNVRLAALLHEIGRSSSPDGRCEAAPVGLRTPCARPSPDARCQAVPVGARKHGAPPSPDVRCGRETRSHHDTAEETARSVLSRLRFDSHTVEAVGTLVREHMIRYDIMSPKDLKKFITRVGVPNLGDLFDLQAAHAKASGSPADSSKVLEVKAEVERVLARKEPLTVRDLAVTGRDLIEWGLEQGKDVGTVLNAMLERVLDEPNLNTREHLRAILEELKGHLDRPRR